MASTPSTSRHVAFTVALSAVVLSSCSLPPKQAWRKIRNEGLVAYVSYEVKSQHRYSHLKKPEGPAEPIKASSSSAVAGPILAENNRVQSPPSMPLASVPTELSTEGKTLAALPVPSLAGFVRSPYTSPPRLVDVKGASAGSTMVCPYTGRPFIVPNEVGTADTMVAKNDKPADAPPSPVMITKGEKKEASATAPVVPAKSPTVAATRPAPAPEPAPAPAPVEQPKPKPVVADTPPAAPAPSVTPPPAPAPAPARDVPYGNLIAGRPGFVNSPYAAKHQLVDVTGLPAGMEVKCPYTGKLFRVPAQDMATTKPADAPAVASPEKKK